MNTAASLDRAARAEPAPVAAHGVHTAVAMQDALLALDAVRFAYPGSAPVLGDVTLAIAPGEMRCLLGRSGCGKTTLLKLAAGLLRPTAGRVRWRGRPVDGPVEGVGFVFQRPALLAWLDVLDNVLLPLSLHRRVTAADRRAACALLERIGLDGLHARRPAQLSGGQQSRVALARALIDRPALLCMDEPFAALDALSREALQQDLRSLCVDDGMAVLFVTHDLVEAAYLGDRVAVMAGGKLVADEVVPLPPRRTADLRHGSELNACCARLRAHLER